MDFYTRSARYYDLIYGGIVDYERECDLLEGAFVRYGHRKIRRVLDVGCGSGGHALVLAARGYDVRGVDRNEEFIAQARAKAGAQGGVRFEIGDMRDLPGKEVHDAVISMFGAFDHLPREDAPAALGGFAERLVAGGLLLFEWWNVAGAIDGHQDWLEREEGGLHLVRLGQSKVDAEHKVADITLKHLVFRDDRLEETFTEREPLALYRTEEIRSLLEKAGLESVAMLDWTRKSLEPARPNDYRILAVARRT